MTSSPAGATQPASSLDSSYPEMEQILDHQAIKRINPQRYPVALVDALFRDTSENNFVGIKSVSAMEPCFQCITNDDPIGAMRYPSSLMTESFCQAAGLAAVCSGTLSLDQLANHIMMIVSMGNLEFMEPAYPGNTLMHYPVIKNVFSDAVVISGKTCIGTRIIARFDQLIVAWRPVNAAAA